MRALVAVRYESGDTAGTLAEYETFARRLRDELDAAPMVETAFRRAAEEVAQFAERIDDAAVRAAFRAIPVNARILSIT